MITIIHGDDIVFSRKKLTDLIEVDISRDILRFEGEKATITDIIQAFETQSLFGQKKIIILEKFLETKDKELIASILNHIRKYPEHDVIFWEAKEIKKELLSLFPKQARVDFFKQERLLFQFLDSIKPGNTKYMLSSLSRVREKESEELIFHMIVRQVRLLLGITTYAGISEVTGLAPWQRGRLEGQARKFSLDRLTKLYKKLFQIEQEIKTGSSTLPLPAQLDLFLASI